MLKSGNLRIILLITIITVSFLLKVQEFGKFLVPDEETILEMVRGLQGNPFPEKMPPPLSGYPPLFIYLHYFLALFYSQIAILLGFFSSSDQFFHSSAAMFFVLKSGQLANIFLSSFQIYLVWKIGQRFFSEYSGWFAALLIAFHPHFILNSRIFKSDMLLALLFSVILCFLLEFINSGKNIPLIKAAFVSGLAAACKYNGAVIFLLIPLTILLLGQNFTRKKSFQLLSLSLLSAGSGFLIGAPNWIANPVSNLQHSIRYALYHFREFSFYEPPHPTYWNYIQDILQTNGPLLFLLFAGGIVFILLKRKREELLLLFSFLCYFLIQGKSTFFGSRIILPVYGSIFLIIAISAGSLRTILNKEFLQKATGYGLLIFLLILSAIRISDSIALYSLWQTESTLDQSWKYRKAHFPLSFSFARENFTPRYGSDIGNWDLASIPDDFFQKKSPPFLTTGLLSEYLLTKSKNETLKNELKNKLKNYCPFHYIEKPRFGPWDGNITFWYRIHPKLLKFRAKPEVVNLPRMVCEITGNSILLPWQQYEKESALLRLKDKYHQLYLSSKARIKELKLLLYAPQTDESCQVFLNDQRVEMQTKNHLGAITFRQISPQKFKKEIRYELRIVRRSAESEALLLIQPDLEEQKKPIPQLSHFPGEKIPELFSPYPLPSWMIEFYRKTKVDLSLLTLTQRLTVFEADGYSAENFMSNWYYAPSGNLIIEVSGNFSCPETDQDQLFLLLEIFSFDGNRSNALSLTKSKVDAYTTSWSNKTPSFFRIRLSNHLKNRFILKKISILPDFHRMIQARQQSISDAGVPQARF